MGVIEPSFSIRKFQFELILTVSAVWWNIKHSPFGYEVLDIVLSAVCSKISVVISSLLKLKWLRFIFNSIVTPPFKLIIAQKGGEEQKERGDKVGIWFKRNYKK